MDDTATRRDPAPRSGAIGAVVVSHFSASTLATCLRRLLRAEGVAEVVVIDNGSGDESVPLARAVAAADTRLRVVANTGNPGYAAACNQGAALLASPWLAFVNPDLIVEADTLARLRAALAADPGLGLVGAELVDAAGVPDPASRRADPSLARLLTGRGSRHRLALAADPATPVQAVEAVSGALMLLPRGLFERLGGFDAGYRLHAEDLDLCRRVREAGHRVAVVNGVQALHVKGVSSRQRPLWVEWHKHRGLWRYFRKFEGPRRGLVAHVVAGLVIAAHYLIAAPRAWWRAQQQ